MNTDPRRTLQLLDELERDGLDDDGFERLHHFSCRANGLRRATIRRHRRYCEQCLRFRRDGNNARVQRRLELILHWHREAGGSFADLADRAAREIPFKRLLTVP